jgi:hypothetical protein
MFSKQEYSVNESSCSVKWKNNGNLPKNAKKYISKNNYKKVLKITIFGDLLIGTKIINFIGKQEYPVNESSCSVKWKNNRNLPKNAKKYISKNNYKKVLKIMIFRDLLIGTIIINFTDKQEYSVNESSCSVNRNIQLMKAHVQ